MTRNELLNKISDIAGQAEDLSATLQEAQRELKNLISAIENLPSEPDEITIAEDEE